MSWFGDIFNDIGRALDKVIPNEVKPIVKAIAAPVAIAATGVVSVPAMIAVAAAANIATGQKPEDAIKNAAIGTVAGQAGQSLVGSAASQITNKVLGDTAKNIIVGGTTVGNVVTGAITKGVTGAATSALTGQDVGKGAVQGIVTGGVSPIVSGFMDKTLSTGQPSLGGYGPQQPTGLQAGLTGGITPLVSGTLGRIATGKTPEDAFKQSIPGAIGGSLSGVARYGLGLDQATADILGQTGGTAYQYLTRPSSGGFVTSGYDAGGGGGGGGAQQSYRFGSTASPSSTLGQSLSIAPSLGYSPEGAVFGVGGDGDKPKRKVWNVASLRNVGESEA